MIKLTENIKLWFSISIILIVPGIISLAVWGLRLGIDFKGGTLAEYSITNEEINTENKIGESGKNEISTIYEAEEVKNFSIQTNIISANQVRLFVKSESITQDKQASIVQRLADQKIPITQLSLETIDPQVGADVTRKAIMAIIVASLAIIGYIALSFRGVPKPTSSWQFGILAVVALIHDVLFILGFYSLMGHFVGWEVQAEFVTAALTVMGFSVHDTIVVFDRLRENLKRYPSHIFSQIADISVSQTIARSLNTSLTVVLVLLAIVLLGGESIRPFALTLLVGIAVGTYSSIFVATPLLTVWQNISQRIILKKHNKQ